MSIFHIPVEGYENVDEQNTKPVANFVFCASISRHHGCLNNNAAGAPDDANCEDANASKAIEDQTVDKVHDAGPCVEASVQEQRERAVEAQCIVQQDLIIVNDEDASALGDEKNKEAGQEALAVARLAKEREDIAKVFGTLKFYLRLDLDELLAS